MTFDPSDAPGPNSTVSFSFETPSKVISLSLLDVEKPGGSVCLYDAQDTLITTLDLPACGPRVSSRLDINVEGVAVMDVHIAGTGAIDDLCYISPAPGTAVGSLGLGGRDEISMVDVFEDAPWADPDPMDFDLI